MARLTLREELSLEGNQLTGCIPSELGDLRALERLDLAFNEGLTGSLPGELQQRRMTDLNLAGTMLCVPEDAAFLTWAATIENYRSRGLTWREPVPVASRIEVVAFDTPATRDDAGGAAEIEAVIDLWVAECITHGGARTDPALQPRLRTRLPRRQRGVPDLQAVDRGDGDPHCGGDRQIPMKRAGTSARARRHAHPLRRVATAVHRPRRVGQRGARQGGTTEAGAGAGASSARWSSESMLDTGKPMGHDAVRHTAVPHFQHHSRNCGFGTPGGEGGMNNSTSGRRSNRLS